MELGAVIAILSFVIVIFALIVSHVQFHRCEVCKRLFAGQIIAKDRMLLEYDEKHRPSVKQHLKCKHCGHEWTARSPVS